MLKFIQKTLIILISCLFLSMSEVFALDSTISYININNLAYQDVEIVLTDKSEILVPFKQLADLFNITYTANRVDKQISFTTLDGKSGIVSQQGVFIEDYPLSKTPAIFIGQGIMDGVFNEAYITPDVAEKIFGIKLETSYDDLSLKAKVERDIPILRSVDNILAAEDIGPKAYQDIVAPKKPGKITLNKIGLRSNLINDNTSTRYSEYKTINDTFTASTQASISGNIYGGKYRIEANEYHSRSDAFMFGGVTGTYANKFKSPKSDKTYYYELGKVKGVSDIDAMLGTNIFGAQLWDYDYDKEDPKKISGYVKPTSLVKLTVNDLEPVTLSTYAGYYTLRDVKLPNPVISIKLEEINEDGTIEPIKTLTYNIYGNQRPFEKEKRGSVYAGVWGYQNRFFREGANIYRGNNKKVTAGIDYQQGLKDNITFESRLTSDKIYEKNAASVIYRLPTGDTLLVSGTQKSVNYLEGATSLNSVEFVNSKNKNLKARATAGASIAHDIREDYTKAGFLGKLTGDYEKDLTPYAKGFFQPKRFTARAEAFHSSPDWYIASSDSTSQNDRTGGRVSGTLGFNSTSVSGNYSKYYSNLNHRYSGGTLKFDEAGINAGTRIPKVANLNFSSYYRRGSNDLGRNVNYNYDVNATRNIKNYADIQFGRRQNSYDTRFDEQNTFQRNILSKHTDNYAKLTVPIPGNHGKFVLGHSMIKYNTLNYKNRYNMFRFGYVFPTWKHMSLGLSYGFRYCGQSGNDFGITLGYNAKSGQTINVGYQYTQNGGYFIDNMFMPTTNRHTITFGFNDAFQLFNHGLKSVGHEDLNKGIFEAIAFVDVNKNGKFDRKIDIPIKDVPLVTSWGGSTLYTSRFGRAYSQSLDEGVYNVSINMNELPYTVAPVSNDVITKTVKISGGQTTRLEIPLSSTVGSVSGTLKIFDDYDRNLKITDFIVVILDKDNNEVNYSTVTSDGEFYISGLAPGSYTLRLDERFVSAYGLEELEGLSAINISIPYDYNNPTDISDLKLEYKTISL